MIISHSLSTFLAFPGPRKPIPTMAIGAQDLADKFARSSAEPFSLGTLVGMDIVYLALLDLMLHGRRNASIKWSLLLGAVDSLVGRLSPSIVVVNDSTVLQQPTSGSMRRFHLTRSEVNIRVQPSAVKLSLIWRNYCSETNSCCSCKGCEYIISTIIQYVGMIVPQTRACHTHLHSAFHLR